MLALFRVIGFLYSIIYTVAPRCCTADMLFLLV